MGIFANAQYLHDEIREAPPGLVRPGQDGVTTVFLKRDFAYDTVEVSVRYYRSHELGDPMYSTAFEYAITDDTKLRLTGDGFDGDPRGIFGQFAERDRVTVAIEHVF
ncbi:MAG: hypothetical protein P8008_00995 [Gammaproteobacteria bacterium]